MNWFRILFTYFLMLPLILFSQETENLKYKVLKDSNENVLNIYDIIELFPTFDSEIKSLKSRIYKNDSLIQNYFYNYIPIKKNDSLAIYLYSFIFAEMYMNKNEFHIATVFYELALSHDPEKINDLSFALGTCYYFSSQLDSAFKYLTISNELNPNNTSIIINLGWISAEQGNPKKALYYFESAFNLEPKESDCQNNYGYGLYLNDRMKEAEKNILAAKKKDPKNPFIYRNLGLIYMKKGKRKKACQYLQKSIDLGILAWGKVYTAELESYCDE